MVSERLEEGCWGRQPSSARGRGWDPGLPRKAGKPSPSSPELRTQLLWGYPVAFAPRWETQ